MYMMSVPGVMAPRRICFTPRNMIVALTRPMSMVAETLTATSVMSLSATMLMGLVSATIMFLGVKQILRGAMTPGTLIMYMAFLAMLVAPVFQIVAIGTQLTEAFAGLDRTREILSEKKEDEAIGRTAAIGRIRGEIQFEHVDFAYDVNKPVLF